MFSIADQPVQVKQIRTIYQAHASLSRQKHLEFVLCITQQGKPCVLSFSP